jgi:4-hydroxybenzoyl-CoA thioesterase
MLMVRREVRIEWGDCDPAGIVFYPRYFAMFDNSTSALMESALGMRKFEAQRTYDFAGFPLVATRGKFLIPTRYGDDVVIETEVSDVRRSSVDIVHRLLKAGQLAVDASETRVWVGPFAAERGMFRAQPIPEKVVDRFRMVARAPA